MVFIILLCVSICLFFCASWKLERIFDRRRKARDLRDAEDEAWFGRVKEIHFYILESRSDYIMDILRKKPVYSKFIPAGAKTDEYIYRGTCDLLYMIHKLNVRPK